MNIAVWWDRTAGQWRWVLALLSAYYPAEHIATDQAEYSLN
jgi:hypothetical protein